VPIETYDVVPLKIRDAVLVGVQVSAVQGSPSAHCASVSQQFAAAVLTQVPPWQVSAEHSAPSSQSSEVAQHPGWGLYALTHAPAAQESTVHAFASSHGFGRPEQLPAEHVSPIVQPFPSSQETVLFECPHVPALHASFVQTLPSLQSAAVTQHPATGEYWQTFPTHDSVVHGLPSLQSAGTVHVPAPVVKVRVAPVVLDAPSETTAYHSYVVEPCRPGQGTQTCELLGPGLEPTGAYGSPPCMS